jgi:dolichol kinase
MRISATFDPAPYIYPTLLPVIVSLSLYPDSTSSLLPNLVLGLAAIPQGILSLKPTETVNPFQWMLSLIPTLLGELINGQVDPRRELFSVLYPFHAHLLPLLYFFTTTSLLPAELELLSISLLNLLCLSKSPPAKILSIILWVGGSGVSLTCTPFIQWGVQLARIPRWRLKKTGRIAQARKSVLKLLNQALAGARKKPKADKNGTVYREVQLSDADDDAGGRDGWGKEPPLDDHLNALKLEVITALKQNFFPVGGSADDDDEVKSAVEKTARPILFRNPSSESRSKRRRHTLSTQTPMSPVQDAEQPNLPQPRRKRKRRFSSSTSYFLSLTYEQAVLRKWTYAAFIYGYMVLIVLLPVRYLVSNLALGGAEPFGWAIGYMFGDFRKLRMAVVTNSWLEWWIPLTPLRDTTEDQLQRLLHPIGRAQSLTEDLGAATTRLYISLHCVCILILGLLAVLTLDFVEVDTRRKVFHGMMVVMLLPTTFIDPPFISLALGLVLCGFLILDLLRAGQVPPVSRPIAQFLTPYVDGRDLRGPVVISHVFLLIGCAVPLWLSMSAAPLPSNIHMNGSPVSPWVGWTFTGLPRSLDMVSGAICVGMGDAMASLVGRRIGRNKWPWSGGKSFEGSLAFTFAVMAGLVASKAWLVYGQWEEDPTETLLAWNWGRTAWKGVVAGGVVAGMEAALTGGNDNVVVPIVLWILVRVLGM